MTFLLPDGGEHDASVVGEIPSPHDNGEIIVIRQFHGGRDMAILLAHNEQVASTFIRHHNQIRSLCTRLLARNPTYFMEEMRPEIRVSLECDFGKAICAFETRNAVSAGQISIQEKIKCLFSLEEWNVLQADPSDLDWEQLEVLFSDGLFINGYFDRIQGSFRHAAWMLANGKGSKVPAWEPNPWIAVSELPDSDADWSDEQRALFDHARIDALVKGIRAQPINEPVVVVMGASHTRSGVLSPQIPYITYFEDALPKLIPDRSLIVLETHAKPWTMVNWATK